MPLVCRSLGGEHARHRVTGALIGIRPQVPVGVEGLLCAGVPEALLHGLDALPVADQPRGVVVPQCVQADPTNPLPCSEEDKQKYPNGQMAIVDTKPVVTPDAGGGSSTDDDLLLQMMGGGAKEGGAAAEGGLENDDDLLQKMLGGGADSGAPAPKKDDTDDELLQKMLGGGKDGG